METLKKPLKNKQFWKNSKEILVMMKKKKKTPMKKTPMKLKKVPLPTQKTKLHAEIEET